MEPLTRRAPTILVIDDDAEQRDVLRRRLGVLGAHVVVAANGSDGLVQLECSQPDAVLCDLGMPTMDGIEFAKRMRSQPQYREMPLIAVTGRAHPSDLAEMWRVGFDGHLPKPLLPGALAGVVQGLAQSSVASLDLGA